ncbi:type I toxin-antitoxin system Fst family toxin [uncultured Secundilactobacillus sp.]|nr:type I toxin-antitoxin system Fst family toxin [uncultured Secundilactobacillus sp.]
MFDSIFAPLLVDVFLTLFSYWLNNRNQK